jgi:hypothetical protein
VLWDLLTDAAGWPDWNTTVTRVDGRIALGEKVTVHVKAAPGRAFPVKVVAFEPPFHMVWQGGLPFGLFKGTRTYSLRPSGPEETAFDMREVYSGPLAGLITRSIPDLQPAFDEFAACLYARAVDR